MGPYTLDTKVYLGPYQGIPRYTLVQDQGPYTLDTLDTKVSKVPLIEDNYPVQWRHQGIQSVQ